jgi:hypothetical protein
VHSRSGRRGAARGSAEGGTIMSHRAVIGRQLPSGRPGGRSKACRADCRLRPHKTRLTQRGLTLHAIDSTFLSFIAMGQTVSHLPNVEWALVNSRWRGKLCQLGGSAAALSDFGFLAQNRASRSTHQGAAPSQTIEAGTLTRSNTRLRRAV